MKGLQLLFVSCLLTLGVAAKVTLPSVIDHHMVLQRETQVPLWGETRSHQKVTITTSWNNWVYTVKADAQGAWKVKVQTPKAGGPFQIHFNDGELLVLTDILIGEVWVCAGQSNMEMPVQGFRNQPVLHSNEILLDADNGQIRLFQLERAASMKPQPNGKAVLWQESNAESVRGFSAVGYQFAKILQEKLGVPIGIIGTYWGGTKIEAWMNRKSLQPFQDISVPADTVGTGKNTPTALYNAMVHPLVGFGIRGMIWYQGEQNRMNPHQYDQLMLSMVNSWRNLWNQGEWPFYFVQIAPFGYKDKLGPAAPIREAQEKAARLLPNSGMVVSMDVGEEANIHPANKTAISRRLAYWALAKTYHKKGIAFASPTFKSMEVKDNGTIAIKFDHAPLGLTSHGKALSAFEVAGADQQFYPAKARITGDGVWVSSDQVKKPVAVRYAYKDWVIGDLFNTSGLPVVPFRTDNW